MFSFSFLYLTTITIVDLNGHFPGIRHWFYSFRHSKQLILFQFEFRLVHWMFKLLYLVTIAMLIDSVWVIKFSKVVINIHHRVQQFFLAHIISVVRKRFNSVSRRKKKSFLLVSLSFCLAYCRRYGFWADLDLYGQVCLLKLQVPNCFC